MLDFYDLIRSVNGSMITIWHNSFLGSDNAFEGWRDAYEHFVFKAMSSERETSTANGIKT
jgi:hypothetical protein